MNRAFASALAAALALGGAACDASKARPLEPTADVAECERCHGYPPQAGSFIAGGTSHTTSTQCSACHPDTVAADNLTIKPDGLHMNGRVDVSGGHARDYLEPHKAAALANIASCTACHGADYGGGDAGQPSCNTCHAGVAGSGPDWKTNCTFCHGTRTAGETIATAKAAPPKPVVPAADETPANPKVGAHQAHLAAGSIAGAMACGSCHTVPTDALGHFSGNGAPGEVAFSGIATKGVTGAAYTGTCNVYCHGAGSEFSTAKVSPQWTSTAALGCTSCHGNPPPAPHTTSTNCNACHSGTVEANNTTIKVAGGLHVNGTVESSGGHPAGWGAKEQHGYSVNANGLESCKTCHGPTLAGGSAQACSNCHGSGWETNCTFCHGNRQTGRQSPPVDTQGRSVATNVSVGVHDAHVGTTIATPIACTQCHPNRAGSNVITDASHIDTTTPGVAEVVFATGSLARTGGAAATYNRASATSATCASTYCHGKFAGGANTGNGATMNWTSTTQATCTSCHGAPPSTGEHSKHSGSSFTCSECHGTGYSYNSTARTGTVNAPKHVNGAKDVPFSSSVTSPSTPPTFNGSCSLTCHGKNHSSEPW